MCTGLLYSSYTFQTLCISMFSILYFSYIRPRYKTRDWRGRWKHVGYIDATVEVKQPEGGSRMQGRRGLWIWFCGFAESRLRFKNNPWSIQWHSGIEKLFCCIKPNVCLSSSCVHPSIFFYPLEECNALLAQAMNMLKTIRLVHLGKSQLAL